MNNKELTELKKIEEIKKDVAEIINNNTVLKEHAVSEDGEEYDIEYIVVKSPFDLQTAIVDYITKTTPDEIKKEAEPVLCFVEGDTAYFTTQPLNKQWGDDWNDAPYEHNAGTPYEDHSEERWNIYTLKFDWDAEQPKGEHYNSPYSVEDINGGKVPWLKPSKWIKDGKNIYAGATMRDFAISIMSTGGNVYRRLYEGDYLYPTKGKQ